MTPDSRKESKNVYFARSGIDRACAVASGSPHGRRQGRSLGVFHTNGDLTTHGDEAQIRAFVEEMEGLEIPVVVVLGNHDHEAGEETTVCAILRERGIHLLDGHNVVTDGVGFAGVKGFGGGFGKRTLGAFGEKLYKEFVQAAVDEAIKLETALRALEAPTRLVLLHYAPIAETLHGEPEQIFPFLGTSRLLPPIETYGADAVFHGHAHIGSPEGRTPSGIPVYNVASMLSSFQNRISGCTALLRVSRSIA